MKLFSFSSFLFLIFSFFFQCLGGCSTTVGADGSAGDPTTLKRN
jgi:hypothetical protein